jgi:dihydroneopterin aldolase
MIMKDSKRWRTLIKRLAYLRAEASEAVESFEESVSEIESRIEEKDGKTTISEEKDVAKSDDIPATNAVSHLIKFTGGRGDQEVCGSSSVSSKSSPEETRQEEESDEVKTNYKRLWRVIAKLTHPDAVGNNEELITLYKAAASAYERDRREELLDVASELNAQLDNPHPALFDDLSRRCVHYEQMIRKIRDSVAWQWKNAQENTKKEIVDLIKTKREEKNKQSSE